jgi:hypothetical protein
VASVVLARVVPMRGFIAAPPVFDEGGPPCGDPE